LNLKEKILSLLCLFEQRNSKKTAHWNKKNEIRQHKNERTKKFVRNRENGTEMLAARQNAHIFFCMLLFFISNSFKAFFSKSIYSKEFFHLLGFFLLFSFFDGRRQLNFFFLLYFVTVDFEQIERFFITNSSNNHDDDDDRDKKLNIKKKTILFDLIASLNSTEKGTTHNNRNKLLKISRLAYSKMTQSRTHFIKRCILIWYLLSILEISHLWISMSFT